MVYIQVINLAVYIQYIYKYTTNALGVYTSLTTISIPTGNYAVSISMVGILIYYYAT